MTREPTGLRTAQVHADYRSLANDDGASLMILCKDLPDKPHVAERVHYGALQHPPNRLRSIRRVLVFF